METSTTGHVVFVAGGTIYLLDNTDVSNFFNHGTGASVLGTSLGVDAIAEFETLTNTYSAQYGGSGAVMNAVSKSGTNKFHGSGFEFLRNSALDARNRFDLPKIPEFRRNQFCGTIGGPIKQNKAFFFYNYEGLRQAQGVTEIAQVPDQSVVNALTNGMTWTYTTPQGLQQSVTINPNVLPLLNLYPSPNGQVSSTGSGVVSVQQVASDIGHEDYMLGRFDYVLSAKDTLYVRVVSDLASYIDLFPFTQIADWPDLEKSPNLFVTAEELHTFRSVVNNFRISFVWTDNNSVTTKSQPALQFFPGSGREDGSVNIAGLTTLGANYLDPYHVFQNKIGFADDIVWTRGAHTLRIGFDVTNRPSLQASQVLEGGEYSFSGLTALLQDQFSTYVSGAPDATPVHTWFHDVPINPYINDESYIPSGTTNHRPWFPGCRADHDEMSAQP